MAKLSVIQTNFTAGELSPKLLGRVDISRYQNGVKRLENALIAVQGGVMRTWGTEFIEYAKYGDKQTRLIPYVFNRDQAYIVEFGDLYCRIYKNNGDYMAEVKSPYKENQLFDINYVQGADTMFLAHPDIPIHRLRRVSDTEWTLAKAPFIVEPFDEMGEYPDLTLTLNTINEGTATATLSGSYWLAGDNGRTISYGTGIAEITGFASGVVANIKIITPFTIATLPAKEWHLEGSPLTNCTPSKSDTTNPDIVTGDVITLSLSAAGFRATDKGKYVKINQGLCQITTINSATSATAEVKTKFANKAAALPYGWSIMSSVWGEKYGYPRAVTLHAQRLFCGGTYERPQAIWMSRTAEYLNFELSTEDDDAAAFTMSSDQINTIVHLTQSTSPLVLTIGGEFSLSGSATKANITPTGINIKNDSGYGCNGVKPVRVGTELFFMQRSGRKLRAMSYSVATESYVSEDATTLSEHITESGIADMAYQQDPYSILWLVRQDGQIATLTIDKSQEVLGWSRQITQGKYKSVATVPNAEGTGDEVWCIVERDLNGHPALYIERFTQDVYSHSCLIVESEQGGDTITGLEHLNGKTVDVVADGVVMQSRTVANGSIKIERNAYNVEIGLPYTTEIELLPVEVQDSMGTMQGNQNRTGEIVLRFLNTTGCKVNGSDIIPFRQFGVNVLDQPPNIFTGDKKHEVLGWNRPMIITQEQPMPFHLLAVISKVTINNG